MAQISQELKDLHAKIVAGELTKAQAAAQMGVKYAHFCMRLKRAGLIDSVRTPRGGVRETSPEVTAAMEEALAAPADNGKVNLTEIARKHGIAPDKIAAFSMKVLRVRRSRQEADLRNDNSLASEAG